MAKAKTKKKTVVIEADELGDDFSEELIAALNKEFGTRIAYNLTSTSSPVEIKHWISSGSKLLDYAMSNRRHGGAPGGRIIEIFGPPSTGKSHIAFQMARDVQRRGGLVVYIDTENAVSIEKLAQMGIDVAKRFVYCDTHCTEEVFAIIESTILKAKQVVHKNVPVLAVWDSVAATSPKAELNGAYDENTVGLQARTISKGMRKITGIIGQSNATLVCLNQTRMKIGIMFGDPTTTPGGMAIPFHASIRMQLFGGGKLKNKDGDPIGINVTASIIKNKVAPPFRKVAFSIIFGKGIAENDSLVDCLRDASKNGPITVGNRMYSISDFGARKTLTTYTLDGEVVDEKKFYKSKFAELIQDDTYGPILDDFLDVVLTQDTGTVNIDEETIETKLLDVPA